EGEVDGAEWGGGAGEGRRVGPGENALEELERHHDVLPRGEEDSALAGLGVVRHVLDRPEPALARDVLDVNGGVDALERLVEGRQRGARRPSELCVAGPRLAERVVVEAEPVVKTVVLDPVPRPRLIDQP